MAATNMKLDGKLSVMVECAMVPDSIVETVAFHHHPSRGPDGQFGPLTAVHVANVLQETLSSGIPAAGNEFDGVYLDRIGVAGELPSWSDLASQRLPMEGLL